MSLIRYMGASSKMSRLMKANTIVALSVGFDHVSLDI